MKKTFNIIICGVGGQGIITLLKIMANAALADGFDVKSSELHGLSQRGGSVKTHIKIGKDIASPLIIPGEANLILGLEMQEALRAKRFANSNTIFLINEQFKQIQNSNLKPEKVKQEIQKISDRVNFIDATSITQKELRNPVVAGAFLLSCASNLSRFL